jgi:hypothetical protein
VHSLSDIYQGTLAGKQGGQDELRDVLLVEDAYLRRVHKVLAESGRAVAFTSYSDAYAFSGGSTNMSTIVNRVLRDVSEAAARTGAQVPDLYCGLWPDRDLSAKSFRHPQGGPGSVVLVNTGLIQGLRLFLQDVTVSMPVIVNKPLAGSPPDPQFTEKIKAEWSQHFIDYEDDANDEWALTHLRVLEGAGELLRREMTLAAISYVIAHEGGHQAVSRPWQDGWRSDNQEFQKVYDEAGKVTGPARVPRQETDAVNSFVRELLADMISCQILRQQPFTYERSAVPLVLGAMAVPALQSAAWWRRAAHTNKPLGWTHPAPEMRSISIGFQLSDAPKSSNPQESRHVEDALHERHLETVAKSFTDWSDNVLGVLECQAIVMKKGLADRGLNPAALAYFYATYPEMARAPSDVLKDLREREDKE